MTHLAPLPTMLEGGSVLGLLEEPRESATVMLHPRYAMYLAVESGLPLEGGRFSRPPPTEPGRSDKDASNFAMDRG